VSDYVDFIPWLRWPVGIRKEAMSNEPRAMRLRIQPNPFRSRVTITFNNADQTISGSTGSGSGHQEPGLRIYDATGCVVKSFVLGSMPYALGSVLVSWDGRDDRGANLPAGVYFIRSEDAGIKPVRIVKIR
jgi:hypothetical protein